MGRFGVVGRLCALGSTNGDPEQAHSRWGQERLETKGEREAWPDEPSQKERIEARPHGKECGIPGA